MRIMNLEISGLVEVNYKVGKGQMGNYKEGEIVKAYIIPMSGGNTNFIFHPEDGKTHCDSIDVCMYDPIDNVYFPMEEDLYANLQSNSAWFKITYKKDRE